MSNSQGKEVLLLGDSNVRNSYNRLGLQVQRLNEFIQIRSLDELTTGLPRINSSYQVIVFAFLTNLIIATGDGAHSGPERLSLIEDTFNTLIPILA